MAEIQPKERLIGFKRIFFLLLCGSFSLLNVTLLPLRLATTITIVALVVSLVDRPFAILLVACVKHKYKYIYYLPLRNNEIHTISFSSFYVSSSSHGSSGHTFSTKKILNNN